MGIVDPDAHVIEVDETWEYMDPAVRHPSWVEPAPPGGYTRPGPVSLGGGAGA